MEGNLKTPTIFGWADTPWTVAALLGAWGVMIGIEEFFLADIFMVLAGASCTVRLARDCYMHRRRRWIPFLLWFVIIGAVVGVDIRLTQRKQKSSEAKAGEITTLTTKVGELTGKVQDQSVALSDAQGHTDQHVSDIQDENKRLRASIDKKDAALVAIAQQEYYSPQIVIQGTAPNDIRITNNGKSSITILRLIDDSAEQTYIRRSTSIARSAWVSFGYTESTKSAHASKAQYDPVTQDYRATLQDSILIETENHKRYNIPFTVTLVVKDGVITQLIATANQISEVTQR